MSTDDVLQSEADALTSCSICTNKYFRNDDEGIFRTPKVLECMHTFCDVCLNQHLKSVNSTRITTISNFPCPTCRKTIFVPVRGIAALPTDFKIKSIITLVENLNFGARSSDKIKPSSSQTSVNGNVMNNNQMKNNTYASVKLETNNANKNKMIDNQFTGMKFCRVCLFKGKNLKGSQFCLNCQKLFCNDCKTIHQSNNLFSYHRFHNLEDDKKGRDYNSICRDHCSDFDYFCMDCNEKLCCICVMLPDHCNHNLKSINDRHSDSTSPDDDNSSTISPFRSNLELNHVKDADNDSNKSKNDQSKFAALKQEFESNVSNLEKKIKDVDLIKINSNKTLDQVEVKLKQTYQDAAKLLEASFKNFKANIQYNRTNLDQLTSFKKELESKLSSSKKFNSDLLKINNSSEQNFKKMLELNTNLIEVMVKDMPNYDYRGCRFNPNIQIELGEMVTSNDIFPEESQTSLTLPGSSHGLNRKPNKTLANLDRRSSDSQNQSKSNVSRKKSKPEINVSIKKDALWKALTLKFMNCDKQPPYRPDIDHKDFMYRGEPHWRIEKQISCRRCCFVEGGKILVVIDWKEVYVERKTIFLRSKDGIPLNILCDFTGDQTISDVIDVCYNPEKKFLYLLCIGGKCALAKKFKLNISTKTIDSLEQTSFKCQETLELQSFDQPFCISSRKDVVAMVESKGEKVVIVNSKFKKLCVLTTGDVNNVDYIAIDAKERIYVSDCGSKEIKIFQKNGEMELKFSSTGPRGQVMLPRGLALDDKGNVLVVDQSMKCVSLYDKDGKFIDMLVESAFNQLLPWGASFSPEKYFLAVTTDDVIEMYKL